MFQKGKWGNGIGPIKDDLGTTFYITYVNLAAGVFWKEKNLLVSGKKGNKCDGTKPTN